MAQHRISFVFNAVQGVVATSGSPYGWTETYYRSVDETAIALTALAPQLVIARRQFLTAGWLIKRIRFANFPLTRQAFRYDVPLADGAGRYGGAGVLDEQPYDKLVASLTSNLGRSRQADYGGIGSDVVSAAGLYAGPPQFITAFANWINFISTPNNVQLAIRISTIFATATITQVITSGVLAGLNPTPTTPVVVYVGAPLVPAVGDVFRISGVLGMAGVNGQWRVTNAVIIAGVQYLQLGQKRRATVQGIYVAGGTVTQLRYTLDPIVAGTPSQGGSRRTGATPFRPRGRRSRRLS